MLILIGKQLRLSAVAMHGLTRQSGSAPAEVVLRNINDYNEIHEICPSVTFYYINKSLYDISRKCILPNMIRAPPTLILIGKMQFLPMSETECFHEINYCMILAGSEFYQI